MRSATAMLMPRAMYNAAIAKKETVKSIYAVL